MTTGGQSHQQVPGLHPFAAQVAGHVHELCEIFREAAVDNDLRALVITGAGNRVFCARADLSELLLDPDDPTNQACRDLAETLSTGPVVINGACIVAA